MKAATQAYQQVNVYSGAAYANPHELITMLMNGALERTSLAKGAMQAGDISKKGELIGNVITIVGGLKGCLNMESGDALSANLSDLYDYMSRCLLDANIHNDASKLDEVMSLLHEIKSAWDSIPENVKQDFNASKNADAQN